MISHFDDTDIHKIRRSIYLLTATVAIIWKYDVEIIQLPKAIFGQTTPIEAWHGVTVILCALLYLCGRYWWNFAAVCLESGGVLTEQEQIKALQENVQAKYNKFLITVEGLSLIRPQEFREAIEDLIPLESAHLVLADAQTTLEEIRAMVLEATPPRTSGDLPRRLDRIPNSSDAVRKAIEQKHSEISRLQDLIIETLDEIGKSSRSLQDIRDRVQKSRNELDELNKKLSKMPISKTMAHIDQRIFATAAVSIVGVLGLYFSVCIIDEPIINLIKECLSSDGRV